MVDLNKVGAGVVAGLVAGLVVGGLGSRIAMRLIAVLIGARPEFTISGTVAILMMGAVLGIPFGVLYLPLRYRLPVPRLATGLLYGLLLCLVFVVPFFVNVREGELGLVSPLVGIAIFGPVPVLYGAAVAGLLAYHDRRGPLPAARTVSLAWLSLFGLGLVLAFLSMASLMSDGLFFPPAIVSLYQTLGLSFSAAHGLHSLLMLGYALTYCGLAALIFWLGSDTWPPKFAALALLLFAAGFFNSGQPLAGLMTGLPIVRWVPGLLRVAGFGALLPLLSIFPDGRFTPGWTRPLVVGWFAWLFLWFLNPFPGSWLAPATWPEPLLLLIVAGGLVAGLVAQAVRRRNSLHKTQPTNTVPAGFVLSIGGFALLWALMILFPELKVRHAGPPATLFASVIYLIPWLLLPLSILAALRRMRLTQRN